MTMLEMRKGSMLVVGGIILFGSVGVGQGGTKGEVEGGDHEESERAVSEGVHLLFLEMKVITTNVDKKLALEEAFGGAVEVALCRPYEEKRVRVQNPSTVRSSLVGKAQEVFHYSVLMGSPMDDFWVETLSVEVAEWNGWPGLYTGDCVAQVGVAKFKEMVGTRPFYLSSYWVHRCPDGTYQVAYATSKAVFQAGSTFLGSITSITDPRREAFQKAHQLVSK